MSENKVMPAVSGQVYWRDPQEFPPPRGAKMLILTDGGVAVISDWTDNSNFEAWSPLPKRRPADLQSMIFSILSKRTMSVDQLAAETKAPRSTVVSAINTLKKQGKVCIHSYQKTVSSPVRIWTIGNVDAPHPGNMTPEQRSEQKRLKRKEEKNSKEKFVPRRDIAASWF